MADFSRDEAIDSEFTVPDENVINAMHALSEPIRNVRCQENDPAWSDSSLC